jgi:xanthine dehydrogenase iron-sulfur cluster and FAD-binding subunit A
MHHVQVPFPQPARYVAPVELDDALAVLAEHGELARPIAGGTDLLLEIERGGRPPFEVLVDTTRIAGFGEIRVDDERIHLGGGVTHNDVVTTPSIVEAALPLAQACLEIGSPSLRNRATVAGNVVTASPANDTLSALLALDATVTLRSASGSRELPVAEFVTGFRETDRRPDELVVAVSPRRLAPAERGLFVKLGLRRAQAISVVHLAVVLELVDGEVAAGRLAIGSVAPTVILVEEAVGALRGRPLDAAVIEEAVDAAVAAVTPIDDLRATADYRRDTVATMVRRALSTLSSGDERAAWPATVPTLRAKPEGEERPARGHVRVDGAAPVSAVVNGAAVAAPCRAGDTLLDWLRFSASHAAAEHLTGTKEGCAEGECGACTVVLDRQAVLSCLLPAAAADGCDVVTVEGLGGGDRLHPVQQAFVDHGAVQCGYCIPGFLMAASALLDEQLPLDDETIRVGLSGNLCRCTGYYRIIDAVQDAADRAVAVGVRS